MPDFGDDSAVFVSGNGDDGDVFVEGESEE
jgi:hypothetical protein